MKLHEILKEWDIDKKLDPLNAHSDLLSIPFLHGKYLNYLSDNRLLAQKAKYDYLRMKKLRREYYLGNLDYQTLKEHNWEQFDLKIGQKSSIELYLDSDEYLIKLQEKETYYKECVSICESIMKELTSRTFQLKEYLTHERFLAGI